MKDITLFSKPLALMALAAIVLPAPVQSAENDEFPIAAGKFQPSWQSLKQYQCPDWFRDAKFGIWAHWSAQCQPEQGDWYAKHMYEQGSRQYKYHVAHYGHPSQFGFKDIDHIWKAEHWDPEKLISLYQRAGAKYFVALANHHDNFDCWNSKYQPWNSVNIGPKKDIVGVWAKTARSHGLRFGVTVHAARAWSWFEPAQGSDKEGPLQGVPYDGVLTKADGRGKWWEGYDPQDLYAQNHKPGAPPSAAYIKKFFLRVKDLVDSYQPDLLYFDDGVMPFHNVSDVGLYIAAHYYNSSMKWHDGRLEAVMTTKKLNPEQRQCLVWDIERGKSDRIEPYPWQTDTCIGGWHYNVSLFEEHRYKTPTTVITMLADIVSKNGNLLLNIPVKGDGTIDADEIQFLHAMADWMDVNSEAIFGTRPWKVFGEGGAEARAGNFNEKRSRPYTAQDIRFTTKGDTLYAIALGWPADGKLVIRTLAAGAKGVQGDVTRVTLLGADAPPPFVRNETGLVVSLPEKKPCDCAWVLKIEGIDVAGSQPEPVAPVAPVIRPARNGVLNLTADLAVLHGDGLRIESRGGRANIGYWDNSQEWASWDKVNVDRAGTYEVAMLVAAVHGGSHLVVEAAGQAIDGVAPQTGSWDAFQNTPLGRIDIKQPGAIAVKVRPRDAKTWRAVNLAAVTLTPVE